ncbi:MAG: AAA family ATPase, partial [Desulfobacterales bacterium]
CHQRHAISPPRAAAGLETLVAEGDLVQESPSVEPEVEFYADLGREPQTGQKLTRIYTQALYRAEAAIARRLFLLESMPPDPQRLDSEAIAQAVMAKLVIQLAPEQQAVLESLWDHRVILVTGGPGTGKTTLVRAITALFESLNQQVALAAPTGRAAKRLAEVSRRKAQTLHRLLGFRPDEEQFAQNRDNPIQAEAVIVDEASMLDTLLTRHLVEAVPMGARLILVGDVDQLPAIGPGNVLADLIASASLPTFPLRQVFRQAQESPLIRAAHQVRAGELPDLNSPETVADRGGLLFFKEADPENMAAMISGLCARQLPRQFHLDARREIQVLCPMHKGPVGTLNLNSVLQGALNADGSPQTAIQGRFRTGDKVMQLRNNYPKDVYNGEIGTILPPQNEDEESAADLLVDFDGRRVGYEIAELEQLTLAYAISVHKSQGSEYPAVVIPLTTQHYPLLQRNLIYTAITRAQRLVVLVGSPKALKIALANDRPGKRMTGLAQRLKELG